MKAKFLIVGLIVILLIVGFLFSIWNVSPSSTLKMPRELTNSYLTKITPVIQPFFDLTKATAAELHNGWTCYGRHCKPIDNKPQGGIALNLWSAYALAAIFDLLPDEDPARALVRQAVKLRITTALDQYTHPAIYPELYTELSSFFTQLLAIDEVFKNDEEIKKILAVLRVWSAAQLIFVTEALPLKNPIKNYNPGAEMAIALHTRNIANVVKWVREGKMTSDLLQSNLQNKNQRLLVLSGALHDHIDTADRAFEKRAIPSLRFSAEYLTKTQMQYSSLEPEKKMFDEIGFKRNSCWSALAAYEIGETGEPFANNNIAEESLFKIVTSEAVKQLFDDGRIPISYVAPCMELADLKCRRHSKYCEELRYILENFALSRILSDEDSQGGFYETPNKGGFPVVVGYSASAQVLFTFGHGIGKEILRGKFPP